ncbi:MAG: hypothetical protein EB069_08605, partial [Actinobacteria bacterium]|nr:hypothetical protein [Actinomycetota bacterium]
MPYVSYTPTTVFTKVMFDFGNIGNFKFSGTVKVSVSDGFSDLDYLFGLVNSTDLTMNPYSNEIVWSAQVKTNIAATLAVISQFANIKFSTLTDYDYSGDYLYSIASPADVGLLSDINISYMNSNSTRLLGISSINSDLFGYVGSRGDIFINYTGSAFSVEGVTFADSTKSRQILLHELLHSLGLSLPFNLDFSVKENFNLLKDLGFDKFGFSVSSKEAFNKEYFTIMSYDDENYATLNNAYTPMILDVIALQQAYGEGGGTTSTGDDIVKAGNFGYRAYFDAGGKDTIDLANYASGAHLNMGEQIKSADHLVGLLTSQEDFINITKGNNLTALRWFYGEFESAVGSSGSDFISGNYLENSINGEVGDDSINGGDGNDTLYGGDGNDTFDWDANQRGGDDSMVGGLGN